MRDIKFRGKTENNIWKYGSLLKDNPQKIYYIVDNEDGAGREVLEKTIGQYTGLKDKNGKEVYEGDIVEFKDVGEEGYEYKEGFDFDNIAQVVYKNGIYTLSNFGETDNSYHATNSTDEERLEEVLRNGNCKVVGNIYDNPELLERGE